MKKDREGAKLLKDFLAKSPQKKANLAIYMGVMTTGAIDKWLSRKTIPLMKRDKIREYIRRQA